MKDSMTYGVLYMGVLGLICAALLTGASYTLRPQQERNQEAFEKERILRVLDVPLPPDPPPGQVLATFEEAIRAVELDGMTIFQYVRDGEVAAVAVPFEGMGVWARITGFLAFEPDGATLRGLAITDHEETPGLGGEIESSWFRDQFAGKRITLGDGEPIDLVQPGRPREADELDGISGATMTTDKIETMINEAILRYVAAREASE